MHPAQRCATATEGMGANHPLIYAVESLSLALLALGAALINCTPMFWLLALGATFTLLQGSVARFTR